jgi:capsular polysaccharide export protein
MALRMELQTRWPFLKWDHPLLEDIMQTLAADRRAVTAGWGYRPSGKRASRAAEEGKSRLLLMEDALVRSLKPGSTQIYGLVADSRGIYYDAAGKSDLVASLESGLPEGWMRQQTADPAVLLDRFRAVKASKYNWYPADFEHAAVDFPPGVLVVDQTRHDASLKAGGMAYGDFERMIQDALDEHSGEIIYLRAHPDHRYRGKHSCFAPWVFKEQRVRLLPPDLSPASCFEFCREIYTGTSLMGMEGLIHGCRVKTYGWNFYAGWGLTEDRCQTAVRRRERKLELPRLFEAAYLEYCHYFDPDSGESCGLGRILDHLELQRDIARQGNGLHITVGWAPWKRGLAEDFFRSPGTELRHGDSLQAANEISKTTKNTKLLLWGAAAAPVDPTSEWLRVEDGFLRSSGLGATFHRPLSWVVDDLGIYFDPRTPSRLEVLLEQRDFTTTERADAAELWQFLRENRLTKYNLRGSQVAWSRESAGGRKIILVPGQVEADASIQCGSPDLKSNAELLKAVRAAEPSAFIIFKVHPDLVAAARHGRMIPAEADGYADLVTTDGNVLDWLERCDEVHTMTSTVGFEAILRQVPVVTYGLPFYAGWGLTIDRLSCPRRSRRLTVTELLAGAMICYPRYLNPDSGEFTTAIQVARLLARGGPSGKRPAGHLRLVSFFKNGWVKLRRCRKS